ncbi:MAG: hypothetical protein AAFQ87_04610 [Bacteroidota bacterium]
MKRITVSSLLLCILMTGSLYAQFDGQNGQSSFYTEVEQENRPDFLQMEEEAMLLERWNQSLSVLGLQNVAVLQEVELGELQSEVQLAQLRLQQEIQGIITQIDQLEQRNSRLLQTHQQLAEEVLDLGTESELIAGMEDTEEGEAEILRQNEYEIAALTRNLRQNRSEISRNDRRIVSHSETLMEKEGELVLVEQQADAVSFLTSNFQRFQQTRTYALNTAIAR